MFSSPPSCKQRLCTSTTTQCAALKPTKLSLESSVIFAGAPCSMTTKPPFFGSVMETLRLLTKPPLSGSVIETKAVSSSRRLASNRGGGSPLNFRICTALFGSTRSLKITA